MTVPVEEKQFFREFTLRICSSLEIDKALYRCLRYVGSVMPADTLLLTVYDADSGTVEIIAAADEEGGKTPNLKIPMPPQIRTRLESEHRQAGVSITDDILGDDMTGLIARQIGIADRSVMIGRLVLEDKYIGTLTACARGKARFGDAHARLWALINEPAAVALTNSLRYRELVRARDLLADDNRYLHRELRREAGETIVGAERGLRSVMEKIRRVAPMDSPVLLLGETGVGKEVVAHALHDFSRRRKKPFIKVDCGAIPDSLIDSELFGHEKGAFTGAVDRRRGRFERAHTGTLFLDEIGELPLTAQIRMLRVIQHREIERVGGNESIRLDIRIVAATHRNLKEMIEAGRFREDLFFRINVFPIRIPPLRERKSDIRMLVDHFIRIKAGALGISDPPQPGSEDIERLMAYDWPGNIRELENAVERALIEHQGRSGEGRLHFDHFGSFAKRRGPNLSSSKERPEKLATLQEATASHIRRALDLSCGKISGSGGAAELLAIHPNTLRSKMARLGLSFKGRG
jgi:transcriptional regulator with GAF, ATPase, and Fis domain